MTVNQKVGLAVELRAVSGQTDSARLSMNSSVIRSSLSSGKPTRYTHLVGIR